MGITRRLERAIDWVMTQVAPRRAALRAHYKRMATNDEYRMMWGAAERGYGYRNAGGGENATAWRGRDGSADAMLLGDLPAFRQKSRELNRDNPLAAGLTNTFVSNVVGIGARPQSATGVLAIDRDVEKVWKGRADSLFPVDGLSWAAAQQMVYRKYNEDGEIFIKETRRTPADPVWFELIEAERVMTPLGRATQRRDDGSEIRDGVERDASGRVVAYWVCKQHPGDVVSIAGMKEADFWRLPADVVAHVKRIRRPGQSRGLPLFHAIMQDLHDLDLLLLASLKRMQVAACFAAFIKSNQSPDTIFPSGTKKDYGYQPKEAIEPGSLFRLYPEEDVTFSNPNYPSREFEPFVILLARRIGAALGVSWQVVLKDFGQSTYSSARTDLLETRQVYKQDRAYIGTAFNSWVWGKVVDDAVMRGLLSPMPADSEVRWPVRWMWPGWQWVDPEKEGNGFAIALNEIGSTTLQKICAENGDDWEEIVQQRARERDLLEQLNLLPAAPTAGESSDDTDEGVIDSDDDDDEDDDEDADRAMRPSQLRGVANA